MYINLELNFKEAKVRVGLQGDKKEEEEEEEIIILLTLFLCNIYHKHGGECNTGDMYVD